MNRYFHVSVVFVDTKILELLSQLLVHFKKHQAGLSALAERLEPPTSSAPVYYFQEVDVSI